MVFLVFNNYLIAKLTLRGIKGAMRVNSRLTYVMVKFESIHENINFLLRKSRYQLHFPFYSNTMYDVSGSVHIGRKTNINLSKNIPVGAVAFDSCLLKYDFLHFEPKHLGSRLL